VLILSAYIRVYAIQKFEVHALGDYISEQVMRKTYRNSTGWQYEKKSSIMNLANLSTGRGSAQLTKNKPELTPVEKGRKKSFNC
jgi:hypothetical protein